MTSSTATLTFEQAWFCIRHRVHVPSGFVSDFELWSTSIPSHSLELWQCYSTANMWLQLKLHINALTSWMPTVLLFYLIMCRCSNPDCKTSTTYRWNDTGWGVATQNQSTCWAILLHRASQSVLRIFCQPIYFRQQHHWNQTVKTQDYQTHKNPSEKMQKWKIPWHKQCDPSSPATTACTSENNLLWYTTVLAIFPLIRLTSSVVWPMRYTIYDRWKPSHMVRGTTSATSDAYACHGT